MTNQHTQQPTDQPTKKQRAKYMRRMLIIVILVFGIIFLFNFLREVFLNHYFKNFTLPTVTISSIKAVEENWTPTIQGIGSLVAVNGVQVTPQVPGTVTAINFQSGQMVEKNQSLILLDTSTDKEDLANLNSQAQLAKINYDRQVNLMKTNSTSQASLDNARSQYQQSQAALTKSQVLIEQKNIKAPFAGKLGIRNVNIGQYVSPGAALVNLQSLDPLLVQFTLPQQYLSSIYVNQPVTLTTDAFPKEIFKGKINAFDSAINTQTRNFTVQAIFPNPQHRLLPGLAANVDVALPTQNKVVSLPQTAIAFSLFGDSVYVINQEGTDKDNKPIYKVHRRYVTTGTRLGDKVQILTGLKAGEEVVSSGQLKLEDGMRVFIDNQVKLPARTPEQLQKATY